MISRLNSIFRNRVQVALGVALLVVAAILLIAQASQQPGREDQSSSPERDRDRVRTEPWVGSRERRSTNTKSQQDKEEIRRLRSKAWVLAEEIERCFPDSASVVVSEATHSVGGIGEGALTGMWSGERWKILGYADDNGLGVLAALNTSEGMHRVFAAIYQETSDDSFNTESLERPLVVNLLASENAKYSPEEIASSNDPTKLPFTFQISISIRKSPQGDES